MRRLVGTLTAITLGSTMALAVPGPANAATGEFGNGCVASLAPSGLTLVMIAGAPTNPQPATAPMTGVITKARFNVPSVPITVPTLVKALRATGGANQFTVIAQSTSVPVFTGINTYDVRVPVRAGDLLGVSGPVGSLACSTGNPADVVGQVAGDSAPGTTATYTTGNGVAIPLIATVEPDADNDGFGDVTQDLCPQSAAYQSTCPVVLVKSFPVDSGKSIVVLVTTDNAGSVKVTGLAKVGGRKIKLTSRSRPVNPGDLAQFRLKLPKALRSALAAMSAGKTIKVSLVASATDAIGRVTASKSTLRLHGTGH